MTTISNVSRATQSKKLDDTQAAEQVQETQAPQEAQPAEAAPVEEARALSPEEKAQRAKDAKEVAAAEETDVKNKVAAKTAGPDAPPTFDDIPPPPDAAQTKPLRVDTSAPADAVDHVDDNPLSPDKYPPKPPDMTPENITRSAPRPYKEETLRNAGMKDEDIRKMQPGDVDSAFQTIVTAKEGKQSLTVKVYDVVDMSGSESGGSMRVPRDVELSVTKGKDGSINGVKQPDWKEVVETRRSVDALPDGTAADSLRDMGIGGEYLPPDGQNEALTYAMLEAKKPGHHALSLDYTLTTFSGGDDGTVREEKRTFEFAFDSDKKGNITVDGKPLSTAETIKTSKELENVPDDVKRKELIALGLKAGDVNAADSHSLHGAMTKVAVELKRPGGVREFEVNIATTTFVCKPQNDKNGKLVGLDVQEKPKPKGHGGLFKKVLGVVVQVLAVIPSPIQPIAAIANAAISTYNAVKNKNPLGIIAGVAGLGASIIGDAAGALSSGLRTVANVANTAQAAVAAVRNKDAGSILGFIAGAAGNLAGAVGNAASGAADTLQNISETAGRAATALNTVQAIRRGDIGGALGGLAGAVGGAARTSGDGDGGDGGPDPTPDAGDPRTITDPPIDRDEGVDTSPTTDPTDPANEPEPIAAAQTTTPARRPSFNEAFREARAQGLDRFEWTDAQGVTRAYTTELAPEVRADPDADNARENRRFARQEADAANRGGASPTTRTPSTPRDTGDSYWERVRMVIGAEVAGGVDAVTGVANTVVNTVSDPVGTYDAVRDGYARYRQDPLGTLERAGAAFVKPWEEGDVDGMGRQVGSALTMALGGGAGSLGRAQFLGRAMTAEEIAGANAVHMTLEGNLAGIDAAGLRATTGLYRNLTTLGRDAVYLFDGEPSAAQSVLNFAGRTGSTNAPVYVDLTRLDPRRLYIRESDGAITYRSSGGIPRSAITGLGGR